MVDMPPSPLDYAAKGQADDIVAHKLRPSRDKCQGQPLQIGLLQQIQIDSVTAETLKGSLFGRGCRPNHPSGATPMAIPMLAEFVARNARLPNPHIVHR